MNDIKVMNHAADNIRILAAAMVEKAKSGHPGGAMGGADFVNVLYSEYLQYDPENPTWEGRDRFFLDPGHMSPMLYGQLALTGKFTLDELQQFRQWGSPTPGHPEVDFTRGVENSSGPLGQGHVYAVGAAIAAKFLASRTGNPTFNKETIYAAQGITLGMGDITCGVEYVTQLLVVADWVEFGLSASVWIGDCNIGERARYQSRNLLLETENYRQCDNYNGNTYRYGSRSDMHHHIL